METTTTIGHLFEQTMLVWILVDHRARHSKVGRVKSSVSAGRDRSEHRDSLPTGRTDHTLVTLVSTSSLATSSKGISLLYGVHDEKTVIKNHSHGAAWRSSEQRIETLADIEANSPIIRLV